MLPTSGPTSGPISFADIQNEFGGADPIGINEYYKGSIQSYSFSGTALPTSGTISVSNFNKVAFGHEIFDPNAYSTSAYDYFGSSVATFGNYAIVGAQSEDDAGGSASGKAYIFNVTTGALVYTLNNPNAYSTSAGDYFGFSVAISDLYAIVSAPYEDDAGGVESGKVYIYSVSTGLLVSTINNPNAYSTSAGDQFGFSVAISGNNIIVSALVEDDASGADSGKAYIFSTTGTLLRTLNNPNAYGTSVDDRFGFSVAISGNYAIVGAPYEGDAGGTQSGKAYIFNVSTGALLFTLDNPNAYNTSFFDQFGTSVAVSGNYAIVGAYTEDDAGGASSGKAYIYNVTTGALLFTLNNPNVNSTSAGDTFGYSVAISDNYAIISANLEDGNAFGANAGVIYVFDVTTGVLWGTLKNPATTVTGGNVEGDELGANMGVSGTHLVISADGFNTSQAGKVYIIKL